MVNSNNGDSEKAKSVSVKQNNKLPAELHKKWKNFLPHIAE
jgi:hypothetical protein